MSLLDRLFFFVLVVGAIGQFSLMKAIARRIKQVSLNTWGGLGRPEWRFFNGSDLEKAADNRYSSGKLRDYVYFKGEHHKLNDVTLSRMVWSARILTVAILSGVILNLWLLLNR